MPTAPVPVGPPGLEPCGSCLALALLTYQISSAGGRPDARPPRIAGPGLGKDDAHLAPVVIARIGPAGVAHRQAQSAPRPLAAAEMGIIRLAYAAKLKTPDEVIRMLEADGGGPLPEPPSGGTGGGASGGSRSGGGSGGSIPRAAAKPQPVAAAQQRREAGGTHLPVHQRLLRGEDVAPLLVRQRRCDLAEDLRPLVGQACVEREEVRAVGDDGGPLQPGASVGDVALTVPIFAY